MLGSRRTAAPPGRGRNRDLANKEELSELRLATAGLADDLVALWRACERIDGPNLSGRLSSARRGSVGDYWSDRNRIDQAEAEEILVRHRPGCWVAAHVRSLTFPVDLIDGSQLGRRAAGRLDLSSATEVNAGKNDT